MHLTPPTVLILASGRGERFKASGGSVHKLQALLAGKPVLQHTLDAVRASGLPWHVEDAGHPGMGDSIAAAVRHTSNRPLKKCSSNAPGSWISKKRVVQTRLRSECEGHFGLFAGRFARFGRTYPMAHA